MKLTKRDVDDVYRLDFGPGTAPIILSEEEMDELRAHLQAERDEQLCRWRDPENPDYVVYPDETSPDWVLVLDESTGDTDTVFKQPQKRTEGDVFICVADGYFAAHPQPKPWEKARYYEIWVLTVSREELLCRSNSDGDFTPVFGHHHWATISNGSREITAGRRIWPEEDK